MKTGMEVLKPRMVVEGSQRDTGRMTRGLKKKRENALEFSASAGIIQYERGKSERERYNITDFIIRSRCIIGQDFVR